MTPLEIILAVISVGLLLRCGYLYNEAQEWRKLAIQARDSVLELRRAINLHWTIKHPHEQPIQWPLRTGDGDPFSFENLPRLFDALEKERARRERRDPVEHA